jgi:flavin reductase (DIM6/NTAB) family NADH-FMN oxidoreductase RutF
MPMKRIKPGEVATGVLHSYMLGAIAPRPIAFASTVDKDGNPNLSPFSFFNAFGSNPATIVFSPARRVRGNTTKDTLDNCIETKEVVINVVNYDLVQQSSLSSTEYPKGVDEFVKAGLTKLESELIKPFRVKESPVQMECKVVDVVSMGDEGGAANLIICEILLMHVSEDILDANGVIDPNKIDLVGRMGGDWYSRASGSAIFKVTKPTGKGIGIDALPEHIRESSILTGNDLGKLGNAEAMPTKDEVEAFKQQPGIKKILEVHKRDPKELEKILHQNAQQLLNADNVGEAWKLLLSLD